MLTIQLIDEHVCEEDAIVQQTVLCIVEIDKAGFSQPESDSKSLLKRVETIDPLPQV